MDDDEVTERQGEFAQYASRPPRTMRWIICRSMGPEYRPDKPQTNATKKMSAAPYPNLVRGRGRCRSRIFETVLAVLPPSACISSAHQPRSRLARAPIMPRGRRSPCTPLLRVISRLEIAQHRLRTEQRRLSIHAGTCYPDLPSVIGVEGMSALGACRGITPKTIVVRGRKTPHLCPTAALFRPCSCSMMTGCQPKGGWQ